MPNNHTPPHHNCFTALFPGPREPVPEENFWTLWCKGRLTEADTLTIQLDATPSEPTSAHLNHPPIFYKQDALPATQPTVSKHWSFMPNNMEKFHMIRSMGGIIYGWWYESTKNSLSISQCILLCSDNDTVSVTDEELGFFLSDLRGLPLFLPKIQTEPFLQVY